MARPVRKTPFSLTPLRPDHLETTDGSLRRRSWQLVSPRGDENCRWECDDGRWVSVTLEVEADLSRAVVTDGTGRHEVADSYEDALAIARSWRR